MTKRQFIRLLEASPAPDNTQIIISAKGAVCEPAGQQFTKEFEELIISTHFIR
jgi:hypothetical protein